MTIEAAFNSEQFGEVERRARDVVTDDERALIDAYLADKGATKIPTGQSGFGVNYRWDGSKLASIESEGWRSATAKKKAAVRAKQEISQAAKAKREAIAARRETVKRLGAAGMSVTQIAQHLGVPRSVVKNDRVAIRAKEALA